MENAAQIFVARGVITSEHFRLQRGILQFLQRAHLEANRSRLRRKPFVFTRERVLAEAPPKYQHPKTGATWTGHGRAPAWIAGAKDRTKFLIASGTDAVRAASVSAVIPVNPVSKAKKAPVAAGAPNSKGQRKGPQPAKYLDPKSGATWSGRGPAPSWLAAAKDQTRFLVDSAGSANGGSAKLVGKKTLSSKVAVKKNVAAKTVSNKIVANATQKAPAKKVSKKKTPPKSTAVSSPPVVLETSVGSTT